MEMKADLTEELAIVKALITKNGQPKLTEEALRDAASKGAARSDGWLRSVMTGTCQPVEPMFIVGDEVDVLNAFRLPRIEEVTHTGTIQRVEEREGLPTLHWISGLAVARTVHVLRLVRRAR